MLSLLQKIFSPSQISSSTEDLGKYGKDWTNYFDIRPSFVVFPHSTAEVQKLVLLAREKKQGLVPSGGRTGLSGGACCLHGEIAVSFEKMNKLLEYDSIDQILRVQSGFLTEEVQSFAKQQGLFYPVDFASRGSSQIGGNVATNAGGIKVIRYGLTRHWVTGLQVVTGRGDILELNQSLTKNATGYDLRHLFVGSEGTLGFITEVSLKLTPPPPPCKVLLLSSSSLTLMMEVFSLFQKKTTLVAFEMFSQLALQYVEQATGLKSPFENKQSPYYILTEVECPSQKEEQLIMDILSEALEKSYIDDGVISQSPAQDKIFWRLREDISESLSWHTPYKNDISVRVSKIPALVEELDPLFEKHYPTWKVVWYGHIGDGNLHINILCPTGMTKEAFVKECRRVDDIVFSIVQKYGGSISAEHGVGLTKKSFLSYSRSLEEQALLKSIKSVFDPDGIMNPGKMF